MTRHNRLNSGLDNPCFQFWKVNVDTWQIMFKVDIHLTALIWLPSNLTKTEQLVTFYILWFQSVASFLFTLFTLTSNYHFTIRISRGQLGSFALWQNLIYYEPYKCPSHDPFARSSPSSWAGLNSETIQRLITTLVETSTCAHKSKRHKNEKHRGLLIGVLKENTSIRTAGGLWCPKFPC